MITGLAFTVLAAAAALYAGGIRRLSRRGVDWFPGRTFAFACGLAVVALALAPPLASHDEDVRVHVLQHLLLGMLAPLLLALSAPVTLALRALPPTRRRPLVRLLHARAATAFVHPFVAATLAVGSMYVLYFTPLYAATLRSELLHEIFHAHMFVAGCLLAWSLVGLDPLPYRPALRLRSAAVVAALTAHAILGRLLYAHAGSLAGPDGSPDQWRQAAQILFYGGDVVDLGLLVAFFGQWYTREGLRLARLRAAGSRAHGS